MSASMNINIPSFHNHPILDLSERLELLLKSRRCERKGYYLKGFLQFEGSKVESDTFIGLLEQISTKPNSWKLQMGGINKELNRNTKKIEYSVRKGKQPLLPGGDCWKKYPSCWIFVGE